MNLEEVVNQVLKGNKEETLEIKKANTETKGPDSFMVMEWNRSTRTFFDKGRLPRQGRRYCLKCVRFDGKRAYFTIEQI